MIFVWNDFSWGFFSMKEGSYPKTNITFTALFINPEKYLYCTHFKQKTPAWLTCTVPEWPAIHSIVPSLTLTDKSKMTWYSDSPYNSWPSCDKKMKFYPKVALDDMIADAKFRGSGCTGSRVMARINLNNFTEFRGFQEDSATFLHILKKY